MLAVVDDPPGERQLAVLVDDRDLRAPAVQVDADPARRVSHGRSSSRIVRPRGRNPRGLEACSSGRRADFLPPARRTPPGPPEPARPFMTSSATSSSEGGARPPIAVKDAAARLAALGPVGPSLTARRRARLRSEEGLGGLSGQVADHASVDDV